MKRVVAQGRFLLLEGNSSFLAFSAAPLGPLPPASGDLAERVGSGALTVLASRY
jgi:hypothetical protein